MSFVGEGCRDQQPETRMVNLDNNPFNQEISEYILPKGFKIPKFHLYHDSTTEPVTRDPDEHLHSFKGTLNLYNLPDPALCKLFSLTLRGSALRWFSDIPSHSISSFSQLVKSFQSEFGYLKRWKKTPHELFYIKQGPYESLKEFVERFNEAILGIGERSNQQMIISAFIHGLRQAELVKDLKFKIPATIEELMLRAYNFYCAEEAIANRMISEFQRGQRGKRSHKRIRRTFTENSSDSLSERKCMLEFVAEVKGNRGPAGAGVVLRDEDTNMVYCIREGLGTVTKGVAEYLALSLGLHYALERGYTHIRVEGESKHVCMQVNGSWTDKSRNMCNWCNVAMDLKEKFLSFEICHVKREYNNEADDQANMAVDLDYGEVQEEAIGDGSKFEPLLKWRLKTLSSAHQ